MSQAVTSEPIMIHAEQNAVKKPWERAEDEPARWFMRFTNYRLAGATRSVHAVYEAEKQSKALKSSARAGTTWYNAAKKYQWEARADAWDEAQNEQKAAQMREIAMECAFTSRPYRIAQLNSMAEGLSRALENELELSISLATVKQLSSLMQEIAKEIEAWGVHFDASCDAAALDAFKQKQQRIAELEEERWQIKEEEVSRLLMKHEALQETLQQLKKTREATI